MRPLPPLLLLTLLLFASACDSRPPPPDTVVLITIDTLRADHTSVFGYDLDTTPNLEALAARGTAFPSCWSQHVETGPSIASMMTSRYPREIGVRTNGDVLPGEFPTLAERFRDAGYETGAYVSAHVLKPPHCGLERGFDRYDARMNAPNLGHERFERSAEDTIERALLWLAKTEGKKRFLWVHLYDPHGLYDPNPHFVGMFRRDTGRPDLRPEQIVSYQRFGDSLDPDDYVDRYDGEIYETDLELGPFLDRLGATALVAITSDHGESLGEDDYWFRHGSLLNRASLHVPLIIAGPGMDGGIRDTMLARNLDVAPTLLDLARLDPLPDAHGRSLARHRPNPVGSFAEALRRGSVKDRTGVDMNYKVSFTTDTIHEVFRPGVEAAGNHGLEMWMKRTGDRLSDGRVPVKADRSLDGVRYIR